jgi:polyisoprenyl-teichoic acid--peptidoglycan teichoic acid transferase
VTPEPMPEKPPRVGRKLFWRGLLAGVLICLLTAGAVSATVMLQVDDIINIIEKEGRAPIEIPEIDRAAAGKAQTLMILGSDRRYGDRKLKLKPRSDTVILVRLDPDQSAIAMMSIPRDLIGVPGLGSVEKINSAYENGGERGMTRTVKRLLSTPDRPFRINHVVTVDFGGFRKAVDYIGCVYADVDRRYFNDRGGPGGYATIDIQPGYQKICGKDALDYVRYRHTDNDLVRAARQQDFLRQVRNQAGARKLMTFSPSNFRKLARVFARYFDSDKGLHRKKELFAFAKTVIFTAQNPVREVRFRVSSAPDDINLVASDRQLRRSVSEFLQAKASENPRNTTTGRSSRKKRRGKTAAIRGLVQARAAGENLAIVGSRKVDFPFYFPRLLTTTGVYSGDMPRVYRIRDERGKKHKAYRLVVSNQRFGEYYGIQGMSWRYPPILDDPHQTIKRNGRQLMVYRDGRSVRLVAWRTKRGAYWVSNTLTQSLSADKMIGIAASLRRFGR